MLPSSERPTAGKTKWMVGVLAVLWAVAICFAGRAVWSYSATPGQAGAPPPTWPERSLARERRDLPTLVMLAHPRCPCTRASVAELNRLMTQVEGRLAAYVLVVQPRPGSGESVEDWRESEITRRAAEIPGVKVVPDEGGALAEVFHAATSGQTALYDRDGHLVFAGGITGARGHEGDNVGRDRVVALVNGQKADQDTSQVFGCSLGGPGEWGAPPKEGAR